MPSPTINLPKLTEPSDFEMDSQEPPSAFTRWFQPYTPLSTTDSNNLQVKPNVGQILRSKRVRYLGITALFIAGFGYFFLGPVLDFNIGVPSNPNSPADPSKDTPGNSPSPIGDGTNKIDWSKFAYTQYVTNTDYLCNSVMLFEILHRLGTKADKLMMYPSNMHPSADSSKREDKLLYKAQKEYGVKLMPIEVQHRAGGDAPSSGSATWADSYTKLLAFNQTQYTRVLSLDSDSTVLQTMDELFLLPPAPVAMPRAYWLKQPDLSSQLVLIQPSTLEFGRVKKAIDNAKSGDFDMEIVNNLYGDSCIIIPHRAYDLLTGEFRKKEGESHAAYLGNEVEEWNPTKHLKEAKFLHFSDWPVPKPWIPAGQGVMDANAPKCAGDDCSARDIWIGFYEDFRKRRKEVCDM